MTSGVEASAMISGVEESSITPMDITAEQTLGALLEGLVNPSLMKHNRFVSSKVAEVDVSKQMQAVAWVFTRYICQELPYLQNLGWDLLCEKAAAIQPRLRKFMGSVKADGDLKLLSLTEQKVKHVFETPSISVALHDSSESMHVTSVCVFLCNVRKDKCVLILGNQTLRVWSFIEKNKDAGTLAEGGGSNPSDEEFAKLAVQEQTGIQMNVLQVEEAFTIQECRNSSGKGSTKFYIMSCHGTYDLAPSIKIEKVAWIPINTALSSAVGPLVEKSSSGVQCGPSLQYFHLLPFCPIVKSWMTRNHEAELVQAAKSNSAMEMGNADLQYQTVSELQSYMLAKSDSVVKRVVFSPSSEHTLGSIKIDVACHGNGETKQEKVCSPICALMASPMNELVQEGLSVSIEGPQSSNNVPSDFACPIKQVLTQVPRLTNDVPSCTCEEEDAKTLEDEMQETQSGNHEFEIHLKSACAAREVSATVGQNPNSATTTNNVRLCHMSRNNSKNMAPATATQASEVPLASTNGIMSGGPGSAAVARVIQANQTTIETGASGKTGDLANVAGSNSSVNVESAKQVSTEPAIVKYDEFHTKKHEKLVYTQEQQDEKESSSDLKVSAAKLDIGLCTPSCSPQTSMKVEKQDEHSMDKSTALSSMMSACRIIKKRRKALSKQLINVITNYQKSVDSLQKRIAECDLNMATLVGGSRAGLQLAVKLCRSRSQNPVNSDTSVGQHGEINFLSSHVPLLDRKDAGTKKRQFHMLKSSIQELNDICQRNGWPSPSYGVFLDEKQHLYSGKVHIRSCKFDLSETGQLSDSAKEAKTSAAACMLSTLHLVKARNGTL